MPFNCIVWLQLLLLIHYLCCRYCNPNINKIETCCTYKAMKIPCSLSPEKADEVNTEDHFKRSGGKTVWLFNFSQGTSWSFSLDKSGTKFDLALEDRLAESALISTTHFLSSLHTLSRHLPNHQHPFSWMQSSSKTPRLDFSRKMFKKPTRLFYTL